MELLNFEKPAKYLGKEWNVIKKDWDDGKIKICLIYPDIYEIGESNLGLKILYERLNEIEDVICERSYLPSLDLLEYLKKTEQSLFSLENKKSLNEFDIIGFSLQSELTLTNVIEILKISKIPVIADERKRPFLIAGGCLTLNPLPFQDFFDFIFIGEAEEGIIEFVEKFRELKNERKEEILKEISKIEGFYVPSIKRKVKKRYVDINKFLYPENYIVPVVSTVHDRLNVEVMRGCGRRCKFCQARKYYFPYRFRKKEKVLHLVYSLLKKTGYEEVSLSGLSVTDHPEINEIVNELVKNFKNKGVSLSIPSLRPTKRSLEVAKKLMELKRINLTFAPESPYKEIRENFGKDFDEDEFLEGLKDFKNFGLRRVKLYFVLGLPGVNFDEVFEIHKMIKRWRKITGIEFTVNCSFFVPKAQTEFERKRFKEMEFFKEERKFLKSKLKDVKFHNLEKSFLEAVFSRGNENLSKVILRANSFGCIFDEWKERMNFDIWMKSFEKEGIDPFEYAYREFEENEELPWSFVEC